MVKFYTTPEAEVVMLSEDDVIRTSSTVGGGGINEDGGFGDIQG